jgi:hypothetical protein
MECSKEEEEFFWGFWLKKISYKLDAHMSLNRSPDYSYKICMVYVQSSPDFEKSYIIIFHIS